MKPKPPHRLYLRSHAKWAGSIQRPPSRCSCSALNYFSMPQMEGSTYRIRESVLTLVSDPANPKRQLAELRIAQIRLHPKGSQTLLSSLVTLQILKSMPNVCLAFRKPIARKKTNPKCSRPST